LFEITPSSGGQFVFWRFNGGSSLLAKGPVPSLLTGFGQSNVITIELKGNTFTFSVNMKQLGNSVTDNSNQALSSGAIGLSADGLDTEVAFSHLYINKL
jgi:hypothetical protein